MSFFCFDEWCKICSVIFDKLQIVRFMFVWQVTVLGLFRSVYLYWSVRLSINLSRQTYLQISLTESIHFPALTFKWILFLLHSDVCIVFDNVNIQKWFHTLTSLSWQHTATNCLAQHIICFCVFALSKYLMGMFWQEVVFNILGGWHSAQNVYRDFRVSRYIVNES